MEVQPGAMALQLAAAGCLLLSLALLLLRRRCVSQPSLPPSPFPCLPILGNVLHLNLVGRAVALQGLRDKLGPIFTVHVGRTPIIFVTSAHLSHEALITKGVKFAARPAFASRSIFTNNARNINSSPYGPHWRALRRNLVQEMLTAPRISAFGSIRNLVLADMMDSIRAEAAASHGVVSVFAQVRDAMFQILIFMCFGFQMSKQTLFEVSQLIDEVLSLSGGTVEDFYPFLRALGLGRKRLAMAKALREKQVRMFSAFIDKHKELQELGQLVPGSYLETLLKFDSNEPLSIDDLVTLCSEFTSVGTDTTVTTMEWAMARMVENPSVQQKLYDEIHAVVGDAPVEEKDLQQLPYLEAVIKEALRLHPPGHFLLPHATSELCTVGGYDIPPHAIVMFHALSVAKDPELWEKPLEFRPERFMERDVDITGSKNMSMMPFGAGRRICPGLSTATMHMELLVARLVQAFEWSIPPASALDLSERVVFTVRMQNPLKALVKERKG